MAGRQTQAQITSDPLTRMSDVLETLTGEMSGVAQLLSDLATRDGVALTSAQITQLQSVDHICQSLQDLVSVARALASGPDGSFDLASDLQLIETRSILSTEPDEPAHALAGSIELF